MSEKSRILLIDDHQTVFRVIERDADGISLDFVTLVKRTDGQFFESVIVMQSNASKTNAGVVLIWGMLTLCTNIDGYCHAGILYSLCVKVCLADLCTTIAACWVIESGNIDSRQLNEVDGEIALLPGRSPAGDKRL